MSPASHLQRYFALLAMLAVLLLPNHGAFANSAPELAGDALEIYKVLSPPTTTTNLLGNKTETAALYSIRQYKPVWLSSETSDRESVNTFVSSMIGYIEYHGLEKTDYPIDEIQRLLVSTVPADVFTLDTLITDFLMRLAHEMNGDRINIAHLYVGWDFIKPPRNIIADLSTAILQNRVKEYFDGLVPSGHEYQRLADTLKIYREMRNNGDWVRVESGTTIKPGMNDPRILSIKQRLAAEGYLNLADYQPDSTLYDDKLLEVVIAYQARNGLLADGEIGRKSFTAMNIPLQSRIDQIKANMERLRNLPDSFPARYAVVNIADSSVKVFDNNQVIYHAPVIAGRTSRKTPFIQSAIRSIIFNPAWHVPAKIAREDILPKLRKDPHYLEKMGYVIKGNDGLDPHGTAIDWEQITAADFAFRLRQAPGEMNSLGRIKFDFDNDFAVYMHGTPHEELFEKADRHLSSGCVRLKDPEDFAVMLLKANSGDWTREKVDEAVNNGSTKWLKVEEPLPLYFIYQTAFFPTPDEPIHFRVDDYNYDHILISALKERKRK